MDVNLISDMINFEESRCVGCVDWFNFFSAYSGLIAASTKPGGSFIIDGPLFFSVSGF